MRVIALGVAAAAVLAIHPAAAAWKEYMLRDYGIAKEFPGKPTTSKITYKTPVMGTAQGTVFSVEQDNVVYKMTVIDAKKRWQAGASLMGECVYLAENSGKSRADMAARVENGLDAVYGRIISVDLPKNQGREMTECFFTKGRLYKIQVLVKPAHGDPNTPDAIRFINSLRFDLDRDYSDEAK